MFSQVVFWGDELMASTRFRTELPGCWGLDQNIWLPHPPQRIGVPSLATKVHLKFTATVSGPQKNDTHGKSWAVDSCFFEVILYVKNMAWWVLGWRPVFLRILWKEQPKPSWLLSAFGLPAEKSHLRPWILWILRHLICIDARILIEKDFNTCV